MDADEAIRVRQSACVTTSPDILRRLAEDPSVTVRVSLALNPALPSQVSRMLAADRDARVRNVMSRKLATLMNDTGGDTRQQSQREAVASLTAMIAEAGLRVRANIADTVKDLPNGLRDTIVQLAYDPAAAVCGPIIRSSPVLTQEDLLTLIGSLPPSSTIQMVASRPKIGASVSDAIVETSDTMAIGALLANVSAQIRDATLDALAAQSEEQTAWQAPLIHRPRLPPRAQRMLSEFVTEHLRQILAARDDLDPAVALQLRSALGRSRLQPAPASRAPGAASAVEWARSSSLTAAAADDTPRVVRAHALKLKQAGKLDDDAILGALRRNETAEAAAMLAVRADLPISVIDRAVELRSAEGIVSLAWKAGLSPQTAAVLQATLAGLPPNSVIQPEPGGTFAVPENQMRAQLSFLGVEVPGTRTWMPRRLVH